MFNINEVFTVSKKDDTVEVQGDGWSLSLKATVFASGTTCFEGALKIKEQRGRSAVVAVSNSERMLLSSLFGYTEAKFALEFRGQQGQGRTFAVVPA